MDMACLIVPRAPGAIRVALGKCGERGSWGGGGCFWGEAVRMGSFHGTFECRPSGPMVGPMMGGRLG